MINPARTNRIISWLLKINNNLNETENIFINNLIHKDEIGNERYNLIVGNLREIQVCIDDVLAELENYGMDKENNIYKEVK